MKISVKLLNVSLGMQGIYTFPRKDFQCVFFNPFRSDIMFMQGKEFRVIGQAPRLNPICTTGVFEKAFGLKVCRSSYFSLSPGSDQDDHMSPYFPLNGPAVFILNIDKANPNLMSTKINYENNQNEVCLLH